MKMLSLLHCYSGRVLSSVGPMTDLADTQGSLHKQQVAQQALGLQIIFLIFWCACAHTADCNRGLALFPC